MRKAWRKTGSLIRRVPWQSRRSSISSRHRKMSRWTSQDSNRLKKLRSRTTLSSNSETSSKTLSLRLCIFSSHSHSLYKGHFRILGRKRHQTEIAIFLWEAIILFKTFFLTSHLMSLELRSNLSPKHNRLWSQVSSRVSWQTSSSYLAPLAVLRSTIELWVRSQLIALQLTLPPQTAEFCLRKYFPLRKSMVQENSRMRKEDWSLTTRGSKTSFKLASDVFPLKTQWCKRKRCSSHEREPFHCLHLRSRSMRHQTLSVILNLVLSTGVLSAILSFKTRSWP